MTIIEEHQSPDGLLRLIVQRDDDGDIAIGFEGYPWHTHGDTDRFLKEASGVIHVGANVGEERELYDRHGLRVVWIEPISEVFETLTANIAGFPRQRALQYLVTDQDGTEHQFHVASNNGA